MAEKETRVAAALAAVNAYLQQEEAEAMARSGPTGTTAAPLPRYDYWSQSGRQEMMAMRRLIQLRTFTCFR